MSLGIGNCQSLQLSSGMERSYLILVKSPTYTQELMFLKHINFDTSIFYIVNV